MTSKADKMALLRAQQLLDRAKDKPGRGCVVYGESGTLSWSQLRRIVDLATKHARGDHPAGQGDEVDDIDAIVRMHARTHEAVGYSAGKPVVTERCDECDKPSPCPTFRAATAAHNGTRPPHDAEMAAARDADRVARVRAEGEAS